MNKYTIWFFKKGPKIYNPLMTLIKKINPETQMTAVTTRSTRPSGSGRNEADAFFPTFLLSTTKPCVKYETSLRKMGKVERRCLDGS